MKNGIYILLGLMILLTSCEKGGVTGELEGQQIYLTASVSDLPLTKVPFEGTAPTTSNPLNVDVWASTVSSVFLDENKTGRVEDNRVVSIHTGGRFQSGEPQLLSQAIYPAPSTSGGQGAPVYFVAMHPQSKGDGSKWTTTDGKHADFSFRGCEDVMFAKQVSGAYDTNEQDQQVINSPTLQFEHLLTLITVKMGLELEEGANLDDVRQAWGNVTGMQIQLYDKTLGTGYSANKVTIDLSKGEGFSYYDDIGFERNLNKTNFYASHTDDQFPSDLDGFQLSEKIESVAYVICAPVVATTDSHEYIITVDTANRGEQEVILDLKNAVGGKYEGSSRGKHFGVTLKFKKGRAIAVQAMVENWENGGYGSGVIEE